MNDTYSQHPPSASTGPSKAGHSNRTHEPTLTNNGLTFSGCGMPALYQPLQWGVPHRAKGFTRGVLQAGANLTAQYSSIQLAVG